MKKFKARGAGSIRGRVLFEKIRIRACYVLILFRILLIIVMNLSLPHDFLYILESSVFFIVLKSCTVS